MMLYRKTTEASAPLRGKLSCAAAGSAELGHGGTPDPADAAYKIGEGGAVVPRLVIVIPNVGQLALQPAEVLALQKAIADFTERAKHPSAWVSRVLEWSL